MNLWDLMGSESQLLSGLETLMSTLPPVRWQASIDTVTATFNRSYAKLDKSTGILTIEFDYTDASGVPHTAAGTSAIKFDKGHLELTSLFVDGQPVPTVVAPYGVLSARLFQFSPALVFQFDYTDSEGKAHVLRFDAHPIL